MNTIDYIILSILVIAVFQGFRKGVMNSVVAFAGTLIVIILAFYLKSPISTLMYQYLPFFSLGGKFAGVTVFNILIYEGISYLATIVVLASILGIIARVTGAIEKFLSMTLVLGLPSKILGAVVGFLEGYILAFIIVFFLSTSSNMNKNLENSQYASFLLEKTPILSPIVQDTYNSVSEVVAICTDYKDAPDKDEANLKALDVLLKYEILSVSSGDKLISLEKLTTPGSKEVIDKYRS